MEIKIVEKSITTDELKKIAQEFYISMIKGAVDIERNVVAFGGEYHADAAAVLVAQGSSGAGVWGFNLYFDRPIGERLEYVALINIKPAVGNRDMLIGDQKIRDAVKSIVDSKVV